MVRNTHVPPHFHAALNEALTPTRADVVAAKQPVLDTLAASGAVRTDAIEAAVREREGVPALTHGETLDVPADADPTALARRDVP